MCQCTFNNDVVKISRLYSSVTILGLQLLTFD